MAVFSGMVCSFEAELVTLVVKARSRVCKAGLLGAEEEEVVFTMKEVLVKQSINNNKKEKGKNGFQF
jgi:hypothetical protein